MIFWGLALIKVLFQFGLSVDRLIQDVLNATTGNSKSQLAVVLTRLTLKGLRGPLTSSSTEPRPYGPRFCWYGASTGACWLRDSHPATDNLLIDDWWRYRTKKTQYCLNS